MKFFAGSIIALVIALVTVAPTFARQSEPEAPALKAKVELLYDATIAGQKIEKGSYQAQFVDGAEPVLVLNKDKKEVARLRVDRRDLGFESPYDQVTYNSGANGREVTAITFKKQRSAFVVSGLVQVANTVEP